MSEIGYNGDTSQRSFHKIKKHISIFQNRLSDSSQKSRIKNINNPSLNSVIEAIEAAKEYIYSDNDLSRINKVENYRNNLLSNEFPVSYKIFGSKKERLVKDICSISASPKAWGVFLYYLVKMTDSTKVLEIGTNVGISGSYILNALEENKNKFKFISMEGLDQLCKLCEENFSQITDSKNFTIVSGLYDNTFPEIIKKEHNFDLIFIDGNHQKKPTIEYYEKLRLNAADKAIFVLDDIYYSKEMTEAWNIIMNKKEVNFAIDLYKHGIIIIDKSEEIKNK